MMRSIIESGAVKSSKEMWECYHNYIKKNEHMYKPAKSATPAIKNHLVEKLAPKKEKIIEETEEETIHYIGSVEPAFPNQFFSFLIFYYLVYVKFCYIFDNFFLKG